MDLDQVRARRTRNCSLKASLKRLGIRSLVALVGESRLEAIDEILRPKISETSLVEILLSRYGTQILAEKKVRKLLLSELAEHQLSFIATGEREGEPLNPQEKRRLAGKRWTRDGVFSRRVLEVFQLDDSYLPPRAEPKQSVEAVLPDAVLFGYQRRVKDDFVRLLLGGASRLLIHMPTGAGKTRTTIEGIIDYWRSAAGRKGVVVWLAHSEELCEQAYQSFKALWRTRGDSKLSLWRLWGSHDPTSVVAQEGAFIVASLQKIYSMQVSGSNDVFRAIQYIKSKCEIIIIDEAHKSIAPTYRMGIEFISIRDRTKIIGLTATPGRSAGREETEELVQFFEGKKVSLTDEQGNSVAEPIKYLQDLDFLARVSRRAVHSSIDIDLTEDEKRFVGRFLELPSSVLAQLSENAERNALILGEIADLYLRGKSIIVFALSVAHAHLLTELLLLREIQARCVVGATSAHDRQQYIQEYKTNAIRILVNYGVLTTGFDAPNTNAVVITRPTGSLVLYSQMIGRGIRGVKMAGNPECELVDIRDNLRGFPAESQAFTYFDDLWG